MSKLRTKQVGDAVRGIKEFHAIGLRLPEKKPFRESYNQGAIQDAGKRVGMGTEVARQARQFADPQAGYTRDELLELCALISEVQTAQDDGLPVFSRTHAIRMLSVPKRRRAKLQREAIKNSWSTSRLEAEITAKFGTRRAGGRKRRVPSDAVGLLIQMEQMCESWRRLLQAVDLKEENLDHAVLTDLPHGVRRQVLVVGKALAALQEAVTDELAKQVPGRGVRHQYQEVDEDGKGKKAARSRSGG